MEFLIIENSEWDGLPLVNAIWAGTQIGGKDSGDWYQMPEEVAQILGGLRSISEEGFQARYQREADSEEPYPFFEFEEEEMEWLTDYYKEMVNYYQDASERGNAMLLHLSI